MRIAIVTCSDRCSAGEAEDTTGPALCSLAEERGWEVVSWHERTKGLLPPDTADEWGSWDG